MKAVYVGLQHDGNPACAYPVSPFEVIAPPATETLVEVELIGGHNGAGQRDEPCPGKCPRDIVRDAETRISRPGRGGVHFAQRGHMLTVWAQFNRFDVTVLVVPVADDLPDGADALAEREAAIVEALESF